MIAQNTITYIASVHYLQSPKYAIIVKMWRLRHHNYGACALEADSVGL